MGRSIREEASYAIISGPDKEVFSEVKYLQCCHCGAHFQLIPGSKVDRGICMRCYGVTCGKKSCDPCVPTERRLELMESNIGNNTSLQQRLLEEAGRKRFWNVLGTG